MTKFILQRLIRDIVLSIKYPPKIIEKIVVKSKCPQRLRIKYYNFYRTYILNKLDNLLNITLNKVRNNQIYESKMNKGPIWMFWWQGKKQMPQIVKSCIQSVKHHANGHKFVFIDKANVHNYTTIPKYIYDKLYNHDMTLTHFSDIVRFNLLYNHGGLWIDSTMYCTSNLSNNYFTSFYTSGGYSFSQSGKLLSSKWTEFLIGGSKHNPLFTFMNEFFILYWKYHKYLIDYLLADNVMIYAYFHGFNNFKRYVNTQASKNNPHLYELVNILNDPFNLNKFQHITKGTNLFKLTYKAKFNSIGDTFYNRLIHNKL